MLFISFMVFVGLASRGQQRNQRDSTTIESRSQPGHWEMLNLKRKPVKGDKSENEKYIFEKDNSEKDNSEHGKSEEQINFEKEKSENG